MRINLQKHGVNFGSNRNENLPNQMRINLQKHGVNFGSIRCV